MNLLAPRQGDGYAEKWSSQWHVDGWVFLPREEGVRWDERVPFPVFLVTAEYLLTDPPPS